MNCSSYKCKNEGTVPKFDRGELKHYCQSHINEYARLAVKYETFIEKVKGGHYKKDGIYWKDNKLGAIYSSSLEAKYK